MFPTKLCCRVSARDAGGLLWKISNNDMTEVSKSFVLVVLGGYCSEDKEREGRRCQQGKSGKRRAIGSEREIQES